MGDVHEVVEGSDDEINAPVIAVTVRARPYTIKVGDRYVKILALPDDDDGDEGENGAGKKVPPVVVITPIGPEGDEAPAPADDFDDMPLWADEADAAAAEFEDGHGD